MQFSKLGLVHKTLLATCVFSGGMFFAALPTALSQDADPERGRALVTENCASCHAIGTEDAGSHPEAPPFRELSKQYPVDDLAEALAEGILSGHPDMPVLEFQAQQVEDILAHLRAIQSQ